MKTVLSILGGLVMMGAVATASAQSFDVDQGRATGEQQLQCLSLPAGEIASCLSNTVSTWFDSWF
ncbi:hypothetical protein LL972_09675 [Xanthomonas campestris pv. asclepiadis]|uniref:hypothetical protein n=1 Tax=Xanthomonas campestris TaxID=339 RepID=UPI001E4A7A2C|nr:hypothetical protein [Xanthomonas campestris]MCC4616269.1 hypothetical protein [Xanthomonas campestris pv. asclepiadis]